MRQIHFSTLPNMAAVFSSGLWRAGLLGAQKLRAKASREASDSSGRVRLPDVCYVAPNITIDAAELAKYTRLIGFDTTDTVPATYLHILTFPLATALMTHKEFPLALPGMIHIHQRIRQHSRVRTDEHLTIRVWPSNLAWHHRGTTVDINAEMTDAFGTLVYSSTARYLSKGTPLVSGGEIDSHRPSDERLPDLAAVFEMDVHTSRAYAGVSSDYNPIHLSRVTALAFGFPKVIAHGMYTVSRVLATLGPSVPETFDWTFDFGKPIFLPAKVNFGVTQHEGATGHAGGTGHTGDTNAASNSSENSFDFAVWTARGLQADGSRPEPLVHLRGSLGPLESR